MQPAGQDPEALLAPGTVILPLCSRTNASPFWDNVVAGLGRSGAWNDPHRVPDVGGLHHAFSTCLLSRIAGGIVRLMPLSRPQPMPDLFGAVPGHEPYRGPARPPSVQPCAGVANTADKSSSRYILPKDLSNALQQLDDLELDSWIGSLRL
jgi:hypothetical protein